MTLYELARTILLLNRHPISKVRFARTIYFTHKELVRKKFMKIEDIAYIRSPLGPIPDGFLSLARDYAEITIKHNPSAGLSYATEEYTINPDAHSDEETSMLEQYRDVLAAVEHTLNALQAYTTPQLVDISHYEPSWLEHSNGEIYYLSTADLKDTFPFSPFSPKQLKIRLVRTNNNKAGALQATLLKGMIADIVKESTDLEYPDDKNTAKPPRKPLNRPLLRLKFRIRKKRPDANSAAPSGSKQPQKPTETTPQSDTNTQQGTRPEQSSAEVEQGTRPEQSSTEAEQRRNTPEHDPQNQQGITKNPETSAKTTSAQQNPADSQQNFTKTDTEREL